MLFVKESFDRSESSPSLRSSLLYTDIDLALCFDPDRSGELPSADEDAKVSAPTRLEALAALAAAARSPLLRRIDIDFSSLSEGMALHHCARSEAKGLLLEQKDSFSK
jgi:hypothetical protein